MAEEEFLLSSLETGDDVAQNLELMREVFGQTSGVDDIMKKLIYHHPTMTLKDFFAIKHHSKIVAGLTLIPVKWSIDGIPLNVAEMGFVATLAEYRHRGLQKRLIREFHERVTKQKYDLCAIEGIPYFYRQFGYEYALPLDETTTIRLDQIPDYESTVNIRPFTDKDIHKATQLFMQSQSRFYVRSTRDQQIWNMQEETRIAGGEKFDGYVVEKNGQMIAYMRISLKPEDRELILREITDTNADTGQAVLKFLKDTGKHHGLETLVARVSHHDSLIEQLVALGATKSLPPYAWQIRIVDYTRIFEKIKPLFEKRLANSAYRALTERLNFNFYRFTIQVDVEDGKVIGVRKLESNEDRTIRIHPKVFVKLLLGYRNREELEAAYPDVIVRSSHKNLVDILFPKLPSFLHSAY